jgi:ABC-type maltose transport system permease subunit
MLAYIIRRLMIMIPTLLVYILFQGQIQKGITVGALKG